MTILINQAIDMPSTVRILTVEKAAYCLVGRSARSPCLGILLAFVTLALALIMSGFRWPSSCSCASNTSTSTPLPHSTFLPPTRYSLPSSTTTANSQALSLPLWQVVTRLMENVQYYVAGDVPLPSSAISTHDDHIQPHFVRVAARGKVTAGQ